MNDRELLEMAAKAAWITGRFIEKTPEDGYAGYSCGFGNAGRITPLWNPLSDDGDALRLAVKLEMGVAMNDTWVEVQAYLGHVCFEIEEKHNGDSLSATRRAIVRAAAEIGKAIP